eukprot:7700506-Lingulodinium_polyedra.AAC.1
MAVLSQQEPEHAGIPAPTEHRVARATQRPVNQPATNDAFVRLFGDPRIHGDITHHLTSNPVAVKKTSIGVAVRK